MTQPKATGHNTSRRTYYDDDAVVHTLRLSRSAELRQKVLRVFYERLKALAIAEPVALDAQDWALAWGQLVEWSKLGKQPRTLTQPLGLWLLTFVKGVATQKQVRLESYSYQYVPKKALVATIPTFKVAQSATASTFQQPCIEILKKTYPQQEQQLEDIYQETIMALFQRLPKDQNNESATLFTYFLGIAKNVARAWYRRQNRQPKPIKKEEDWEAIIRTHLVLNETLEKRDFADDLAEGYSFLCDDYEFENEGELVIQLLAQVQENYREAITMRYLEGRSYEEMSQLLGISEQNARTKVSRGMAQLRKRLTAH